MKSFKVDKKRYIIQENGHLYIRETGVILYIKNEEWQQLYNLYH